MALASVSELIKDFYCSTTACSLSVIVQIYIGFWDGRDLYPLQLFFCGIQVCTPSIA